MRTVAGQRGRGGERSADIGNQGVPATGAGGVGGLRKVAVWSETRRLALALDQDEKLHENVCATVPGLPHRQLPRDISPPPFPLDFFPGLFFS